jgi:2-polyprenyl-3-methyl-5-hydroxy-6-metoxy-1,4-benzoquinol methylase
VDGWNHNTQYHPAVLAAVPAGARRALDVGCGVGRLAHELAATVGDVDAIDRDAAVIARARAGATRANIRFAEADFLAFDGGGYDVVTMVAVLHHLPLDEALARIPELLNRGGTCAIVGLARTSGVEHLASLVAWPVSRWLRATRPHAEVAAPIAEPRETLAEIRTAAARHLPGARIERRLLWRYTLVWTKA